MTRRALLRAALTYVEAGWPIVPGATPYGLTRRRVLVQCVAGTGACGLFVRANRLLVAGRAPS